MPYNMEICNIVPRTALCFEVGKYAKLTRGLENTEAPQDRDKGAKYCTVLPSVHSENYYWTIKNRKQKFYVEHFADVGAYCVYFLHRKHCVLQSKLFQNILACFSRTKYSSEEFFLF